MSVKRRRGIGIRKWLVAALKDYAKREGISSHTSAANEILRGKIPPILSYERYREDGDCTKQGVSMPEELWLAIKEYAKERGEGENYTMIACKIIVGKIMPIPPHCIMEGERLARKREADRPEQSREKKKIEKKAKLVEKKPKPAEGAKPAKKGSAKKRVKAKKEEKGIFSKEALEKAEKEIAKRDKGSAPDLPCATGLPPGMSSREFLDAVQDESQEEKILETRAERKIGEDGRVLSSGEPIDEREDSRDRKIKPDAAFYGGVFKM